MDFFRSPYNYDADHASLDSGIRFDGPGRTQQQFRDECDINVIVRRFGVTGALPVPSARLPSYGDFSQVTDFQTAMNQVLEARAAFMDLPARTRERFANDPGRLLAFLADESNRDEAVRLGLVAAPPAEPAKTA